MGRGSRHSAIALLGLLLLAIPLAAAAREGSSLEARIQAANALLGDAERYDEAIARYREILDEEPEASEARLWLARVLAWTGRYDEALEHFERLATGPAPPPEIDIERAEVLSWASRYAEAEAAFEAILARDPENARAWAGLARVHRWAGRAAEAEPAYRRSLALREDEEVRRELLELRRGFPHRIESYSEAYADSDDFERLAWRARGSLQLDLATRVFGHLGWIHIEGDRSLLAEHRSDRAPELELGIERRITPKLEAELALATRRWSHAPGRASGRLALEYAASETLVWTARVEQREQLDASDSFLAAQEGIVGLYPQVSVWKAFGERFEGYAALGFGRLSDHNRRVSGDASLSFRPWKSQDLRLGLGVSALRYRDESAFYYSPEDDAGARLSLEQRLSLGPRLTLRWRAGFGYGRTRELGESSSGPELEARAGLDWSFGRWRLEASGAYARSQRASRYASRGAWLLLAREF